MNLKTGLVEGFQGTAFGIVDELITILGVVIGVAHATDNAMSAVIAGAVAGIANAFSNSIGFYASELAERGSTLEKISM